MKIVVTSNCRHNIWLGSCTSCLELSFFPRQHLIYKTILLIDSFSFYPSFHSDWSFLPFCSCISSLAIFQGVNWSLYYIFVAGCRFSDCLWLCSIFPWSTYVRIPCLCSLVISACKCCDWCLKAIGVVAFCRTFYMLWCIVSEDWFRVRIYALTCIQHANQFLACSLMGLLL